jgi:hypothetical protein
MSGLNELLVNIISEHLADAAEPTVWAHPRSSLEGGDYVRGSPESREILLEKSRKIATNLVTEAIGNGFPVEKLPLDARAVQEGNTAQVVSRLRIRLGFVFKLQNDIKLVDEAVLLQRIRSTTALPENYRNRFPRVYALKQDQPPYAYLMEEFAPEDGFRSLSAGLFHSPLSPAALELEAQHLIDAVLTALFEGYNASVNHRLRPNIAGDYLERITGRLRTLADHTSLFSADRIVLNGEEHHSWKAYVQQILASPHELHNLSPPFVTFVLGDPNPENILYRYKESIGLTHEADIRFIDPKEWTVGDYLFDITKLAHYISITGPLEHLRTFDVSWKEKVPDVLEIDYQLVRPSWIELLEKRISDACGEFAVHLGDNANFRLRFQLGMASNLLGIVPARFMSGRHREAVVIFAEGLRWLRSFCEATCVNRNQKSQEMPGS